MYTSPRNRAAMAYRTVGVESVVDGASPHRLIEMLFDGLLQALHAARGAMQRGDTAAKGSQLLRAVRLLEEGLKAGLDPARGGELANRLRALYDYCINRLTIANLRDDEHAVAEAIELLAPLARSWRQIGPAPAAVGQA